MRILIVDNGTSYLPQLEKLVAAHDVTTIKYSGITSCDINDFDAAILSGGHDFPVYGNEDRLRAEIEFVKNFNKPLFAICFGFELVAHTFGAGLALMQHKEKGILDIQIIVPDQVFSNITEFQVYESHRWSVAELSDDCIALARSKDGIEMIKHTTRPIYASQFHPEMFVDKTCGDEIFNNFLRIVNR